jgi:hypothetical protein
MIFSFCIAAFLFPIVSSTDFGSEFFGILRSEMSVVIFTVSVGLAVDGPFMEISYPCTTTGWAATASPSNHKEIEYVPAVVPDWPDGTNTEESNV